MIEVGDAVRWICPLDADYSYGRVLEISNKNVATLLTAKGYHRGVKTEVHLRFVEKIERGGGGYGSSKKHSKRSATKNKL